MKEIFYERNIMYVLQWVTLYNFMIIILINKTYFSSENMDDSIDPKGVSHEHDEDEDNW